MRAKFLLFISILVFLVSLIAHTAAQGPPAGAPAAPAGQGGRAGGGGGATFPAQQRPPGDPAIVERGRTLYGINCSGCHGADARGGDMGGPNLLRSDVLLNDQTGELILPIVQGSRRATGMDPISLPEADVKAVAEFLHSLAGAGRGRGTAVLDVLVGNATAGQTYFEKTCSRCHSATGDLKGIATKISDPMTLQNFWVSGGAGAGRGGGGGRGGAAAPASNVPPTTVTVTLASGQKIEGRLGRITDFIVSVIAADGTSRTFRRDGDIPKVEVHDPLEEHRALLPVYQDNDIHNVTAYLVTLK